MIKLIYLKNNFNNSQNLLQINVLFNFIYSSFLVNITILSFIIYFIGELNLNLYILNIFLNFS